MDLSITVNGITFHLPAGPAAGTTPRIAKSYDAAGAGRWIDRQRESSKVFNVVPRYADALALHGEVIGSKT